MKYVELDLCCFIPGKVIDEIFTVLRSIRSEKNPPRAYEVLQVRERGESFLYSVLLSPLAGFRISVALFLLFHHQIYSFREKIVTFSLQELRDISSMAMEYFDEKIVPNLKVKLPMSPLKINSGSFVSGLFSSGSGFSLSMRYCDTVSPPSTPLSRTVPPAFPQSTAEAGVNE